MKSIEKERAKKGLRDRREIAKWGMASSIGSLFLTGMMGGKLAMRAHVVSGVALLGFAYWHTTLYAQHPNKKRLPEPGQAVEKKPVASN